MISLNLFTQGELLYTQVQFFRPGENGRVSLSWLCAANVLNRQTASVSCAYHYSFLATPASLLHCFPQFLTIHRDTLSTGRAIRRRSLVLSDSRCNRSRSLPARIVLRRVWSAISPGSSPSLYRFSALDRLPVRSFEA